MKNAGVISDHHADTGWRSHLPKALLICVGLVWVWGAIKPLYLQDWFIENLLVFAAIPLLVFTYRRFRFSNLSYILITIYLVLHLVGAHYTYSEVPIGNWLRDHWHLNRNHYDRLVHFLFGALITYPAWEILVRRSGLKTRWTYVAAVLILFSWSSGYELIEAIVAHVVSPELGAAYNGIQGDVWDAQKDMGLALIGSVVCMGSAAIAKK